MALLPAKYIVVINNTSLPSCVHFTETHYGPFNSWEEADQWRLARHDYPGEVWVATHDLVDPSRARMKESVEDSTDKSNN